MLCIAVFCCCFAYKCPLFYTVHSSDVKLVLCKRLAFKLALAHTIYQSYHKWPNRHPESCNSVLFDLYSLFGVPHIYHLCCKFVLGIFF